MMEIFISSYLIIIIIGFTFNEELDSLVGEGSFLLTLLWPLFLCIALLYGFAWLIREAIRSAVFYLISKLKKEG